MWFFWWILVIDNTTQLITRSDEKARLKKNQTQTSVADQSNYESSNDLSGSSPPSSSIEGQIEGLQDLKSRIDNINEEFLKQEENMNMNKVLENWILKRGREK